MSYGPSKLVRCYNGYIVNGYRFHTKEYNENKSTMNCGVCVKGSSYNENELDYYGIVEEIIELTYIGTHNKLFLFKCHWFDPTRVRVDKSYSIVDVQHKSKLGTFEPFILAEQAQQVYYATYPSLRKSSRHEWWSVCKVKSRLFSEYDIQDDESTCRHVDAEYYQCDDNNEYIVIHDANDDGLQLCDNTELEEINSNELPSIHLSSNESDEEVEEIEDQESDDGKEDFDNESESYTSSSDDEMNIN